MTNREAMRWVTRDGAPAPASPGGSGPDVGPRRAPRRRRADPRPAAQHVVVGRLAPARCMRGALSLIRTAAENLLKLGPGPAGRLLAGRALARVGVRDRAQTEVISVAQSASAPPALRSEAYAAVVRFCADDNDWERASTLFREWSTWAAIEGALNDKRISAWQVRIYHHGGFAHSQSAPATSLGPRISPG